MFPGDPGGLKRRAIQGHRASATAHGDNRGARRNLIEILAVWMPIRYPPADGGEYGLTRLGFRDGPPNPVRHLRERRDADHIDTAPGHSRARIDVVMIVRQAGNDGCSVQVYLARVRAGHRADPRGSAYGEEFLAFHGEGLLNAESRIDGDNLAVVENRVRGNQSALLRRGARDE